MAESKELKQFHTIIETALGDPVWEYEHLRNMYDLLFINRDMCETDEQRHAVDVMLKNVKSLMNSFLDAACLFNIQADMELNGESQWGWELTGFSEK